MKIGFLFGSPKISGGSYVILQHAQYLMRKGHSVDLITLEKVALNEDEIWHDALKSVNFIEISQASRKKYDIALATWWISPFHLHKISATSYAYFVQSIESYFFDDSNIASQYLAHASYTLGLPVITEAIWIKEDLETRFHSDVFLVENGIRKDIYRTTGPRLAEKSSGKVRCLIEGSVTSPFKNIARTVDAVKSSNVDEIWLLTPSEITDYPHVDRVISNIPIREVPAVYRSCDVLVKESFVEGMFGPPLEMFHCGGTAVVSNVTGYDQYIENGVNSIVTAIGSWYQITDALNQICRDQDYLQQLKEGAIETANNWPDWRTQSALFEDALFEIAKLEPISAEQLAISSQHCFNQYGLIRDSLKAHYTPRALTQDNELFTSQEPEHSDSEGTRLYREQLKNPVQPATRFRNGPAIKRSNWLAATRKFKPSQSHDRRLSESEQNQQKRVFGFSISNEHIEEMYHPIAEKSGWDTLYMCTRPKGYFSLGYIDAPEVPDDRYIVSNWINDPSLLYQTIREFDPDLILFHNGNHPAYKHILDTVRNTFDIPIAFSELGWFPQKGNIYFDPWGTNGASRLSALSLEELSGATTIEAPTPKPLTSKTVLLALQLENDTNSLLFSPYFRSNKQLIEYIIESLPNGYSLYIKYHPLDHNAHRYESIIGDKATIVTDPIPKLLETVGSVIAINSTVLMEAMDYPVNIYSCGISILSNKKITIEFNDKNFGKVWQHEYIDNHDRRAALKQSLIKHQITLTDIDRMTAAEFSANASIKTLHDLMTNDENPYLNPARKITEPLEMSEEVEIPPGSRILVKSINAVKAAVHHYDIISFDVFDTLLVRDLYAPQDIFLYNSMDVIRITGDSKFDHRSARIEAEKVARSYAPEGEVTLDEIYIQYLLSTGLPSDIVEMIKALEIETELKFLHARKSALEVFEYAKSSGKQVIIVSDFYLDSGFIRTALENSGYDLSNVLIYVSCEQELTKKQGDLYNKVVEDLEVVPDTILHIGDNFHADTTKAMEHGYHVVHIPSTRTSLDIAPKLKDYLNFDKKHNLIGRRNLEHSVMLGILNNGLFDDPFAVDLKSVFGQDFRRFGYTTLGPLLAGFTLWLRKLSRSRQTETLLFLARDGWVMEQAFREYNDLSGKPLNTSFEYVAASRRIMDIISFDLDFENINKVVNSRFATGRLGDFLKVRLDIDENTITQEELDTAGYRDTSETITLPQDKVRVLKLLQAIRDKITERSVTYRQNYLKYLKSKGIDPKSKIGVVDIGYFGSMQKTLREIIGKPGTPIDGYYVATRKEALSDPALDGHMFGFVADGFDLTDNIKCPITAHLAFLEQIFSAPHPSLISLSERQGQIEIDCMDSTGEEKQWEHLNEIHEGALSFVRDFAHLTARTGVEFDLDRVDVTPHLAKLFDQGNSEVAQLFKNFILENRYNGDGIVLLGEKLYQKAHPSSPASLTAKKPAPKPKRQTNKASVTQITNAKPSPNGTKPLSDEQYRASFLQGCSLFPKKEYASALKHYEMALKLQPSNANLRRVLAETLLVLNRRDEAISHLEKAHELVPENKAIKRRLEYIKNPLRNIFSKGRRPFPVPSVKAQA